jgi:hypothetical protein
MTTTERPPSRGLDAAIGHFLPTNTTLLRHGSR